MVHTKIKENSRMLSKMIGKGGHYTNVGIYYFMGHIACLDIFSILKSGMFWVYLLLI